MALADPTRRAILARLAERELSVTELAAPFAMRQPAISQHLKELDWTKILAEGRVVNRIQVRPSVKRWAKVALDRMLEVQGTGSRERGKTWVNHSRISWCGSGQSK